MREDLVLMVAGESYGRYRAEYAAAFMEMPSRNQIFSAMVVYGFLTYEDGEVFIPNKELMDKYNELLLSKESNNGRDSAICAWYRDAYFVL